MRFTTCKQKNVDQKSVNQHDVFSLNMFTAQKHIQNFRKKISITHKFHKEPGDSDLIQTFVTGQSHYGNNSLYQLSWSNVSRKMHFISGDTMKVCIACTSHDINACTMYRVGKSIHICKKKLKK